MGQDWPDLPDHLRQDERLGKDALEFAEQYRAHYEEIIEALNNLQFSLVEIIWQKFWQTEVPEEGMTIHGVSSPDQHRQNF